MTSIAPGTEPPRAATPPTEPRADAIRERRGGLRLGRILGIEIRIDPSLIVIFSLVTYSLGSGVFAQWHPDWGIGLRWGVALGSALLFFAALLAHELAHSVVALMYGIRVPRITLFLFGGVAELADEPRSPAQELWIAAAGPAASVVMGAAFTAAGMALAGPDLSDRIATDPAGAFADLGPLATLLLWLGPVNIVLAVFNLIPGFPLDGGRVFRAILWWGMGDRTRATQWAAAAGRGVAFLLIAWGALQVVGGAFGGLWLIVMGWFLHSAARNSYDHELIGKVVERIRIGDVMQTRFEVVEANMPLQEFVDECLLRSGQPAWPVVQRGQTIGIVSFDDVRATPDAQSRQGKTVGDIMAPLSRTVSPDASGREALQLLTQGGSGPLPVATRDGDVVGLLFGSDITAWLALHQPDSVGSGGPEERPPTLDTRTDPRQRRRAG